MYKVFFFNSVKNFFSPKTYVFFLGNACTMLPKAKPGTTVSYNITFGVVAATYTCQSFKPGVSFPHCPISTCSNGNKWLKFNTSCSGTYKW